MTIGLEKLAESMDFDPRDWASFEGVVARLTERQEWKRLERAHRVMMLKVREVQAERIGERTKEELELLLWRALLAIYRDRLKETEKAIVVLELLANQPPPDADVLFELAALYQQVGRPYDAVLTFERVVRAEATRVDAYRRLYEIHKARAEDDATWCAADVLAHFGVLHGSELEEYQLRRRRTVGMETRRLDVSTWQCLVHSDVDKALTNLLRFADDRLQPPTPTREVAPEAMVTAFRALDVPIAGSAVGLAPDTELDSPLGANSTVRAQLFLAGREAVYARFGLAPKKPLFVRALAACAIVMESTPIPVDVRDDVMIAKAQLMGRLTAEQRIDLARLVRALEGHFNIAKWRAGVELTATRAGMLLAGDFATAKACFARETPEPGAPLISTRLADLLAFAPSSDYLALRGALGIRSVAIIPSAEALRSEDTSVVATAIERLRRMERIPPELVRVLVELLKDPRVHQHTCATGPSYRAVFEMAVEELVSAGWLAVPFLLQATRSEHRLTMPQACYDQGEYIGDCTTRTAVLADEARQALELIERDDPGALSAAAFRGALSLGDEATVGDLERALGILLPEERLAEGGRGYFTVPAGQRPIAGAVLGLFARYTWDMHHDKPLDTLDELRRSRMLDFGVFLERGYAAASVALTARFGEGYEADKWRVHGNWLVAPLNEGESDDVRLCRFRELPEWALREPDAVARRDALRQLRAALEQSESSGDVIRALASLPKGVGLFAEQSEVKLAPSMPALELAEVVGWDAPVGETRDRHQVEWQVFQIDHTGPTVKTSVPRVGRCPVRATFKTRPTGGAVEEEWGPLGDRQRLGPADRISRLRIGPPYGEVEEPVGERRALECRLLAQPGDRLAREAYGALLRPHEATYLSELDEMTALLDGCAPSDDLEARLTRLENTARSLDAGFVSLVTAGHRRLGGMLAFAPVRLDEATHPLRVLIVANLTGAADRRPLLDRPRPLVTRATLLELFNSHAARFTVSIEGRNVEIPIESTSDFEPEGITARFGGLSDEEVHALVDALHGHEPFLAAQRSWRSLWWLLSQTGPDVELHVVSCSKRDLIADLERTENSALSRILQVALFDLAVLDLEVDLRLDGDRQLASRLAEVGHRAGTVVLAGVSPVGASAAIDASWRWRPEASHLALCGPAFLLRRWSGGDVLGRASFLAAALVIRSFSRYYVGSPLVGSAGAVDLVGAIDADLAREQGILSFRRSLFGAMLQTDGTQGAPSDPVHGSLAATLWLERIQRLIAHVELPDEGDVAQSIQAWLAARLERLAPLSARLDQVAWEAPGRLRGVLTLTVPSPISARGVVLRRECVLDLKRSRAHLTRPKQ